MSRPERGSSTWRSSSGPTRNSRTAHTGFVLDALQQALYARRPTRVGGLVRHSDRGSQYVPIQYTERLAEAGIEPSVGSYDNALAETIDGLYQAEVIHRRKQSRSLEAIEYATPEWVDWFNHRRLLEPIGNIPPDEAEEQCYAAADIIDMAACATSNGFRQARRGSVLVDQPAERRAIFSATAVLCKRSRIERLRP